MPAKRLSQLPNPWNLYNLESSPFFQDTLESTEHSSRPLGALFTGRAAELAELRTKIHGAGRRGSRQAVAGMPGVGKTTLVQELKSALLADGYLTTDSLVPMLPGDTSEAIFGRVLGVLYDTIVANRPGTVSSEPMQDAQILVRASRLSGAAFGASIAGFGLSGGKSSSAVAPDLLIDGPRVMRDLMRLVQGSDAHGVILHVNNLESLSEADASHAAELMRGLRDPMLMHDGLHFVVVGTHNAVNVTINTHAQVRSIFSILPLQPMGSSDVEKLLRSRYAFLCVQDERDATPPVAMDAVQALYSLYRGDLRGLLKALEDGAMPLLGLVGTGSTDEGMHARPLMLDEIRPVLQQRYAVEMESQEPARVDQLRKWGERHAADAMTQADLKKLWNVSQGTTSAAIKYLTQQGYVLALPRRSGRAPIQYVLTGTARVIFG